MNSPTILSNCPPHQGARLKLSCHWIPWWARKFWNFLSRITCLIHLAAPTKVFPLSEYTFWGLTFGVSLKRLKLVRNSVVSRLGNNSKNKARVRMFSLLFDTSTSPRNQRQRLGEEFALLSYPLGGFLGEGTRKLALEIVDTRGSSSRLFSSTFLNAVPNTVLALWPWY